MRKQIILSAIIALAITVAGVSIYHFGFRESKTIKIEHIGSSFPQSTAFTFSENGEIVPLDFTEIAARVVETVVHIKSTQAYTRSDQANPYDQNIPDAFRDFFEPFFRDRPNTPNQPDVRVGTGSGVIINEKGYIVTNNHVITNADDIEVTLHDNRVFKAEVLGTDPATDLALVRIKADDLPSLAFVNSDDVKVGEWVLAIGNPLGLNSTVTAGIVSAKARNINIVRDRYAIESFIQTDAAINPGNSGGALVNLTGGLIGINTAIASPTGVYAGYGFAIPASLVNKVVEDLMEFGVVQRGVLGVMIRTVDGNIASELDLKVRYGAYVDSLMENSAAGIAGIQKGDVIIDVDGKKVASSPELQEAIASYRPGDKVNVKVNRDGKEKVFTVTLRNRSGSTDIVEKESKDLVGLLGAELKTVDEQTASKLKLDGGVQVTRLYAGKLRNQTNIREGFIITKVNDKLVSDVKSFEEIMERKTGGVMLEGVYPDVPGTHYYAFGM